LAAVCAEANNIADRFTVRRGDLRQIRDLLPGGSFDLVVCNPPYYPPQSGRMAEDNAIRTARSEVNCTLEDICQAAAYLLRWGGSFCIVHKPERLTDVLDAMRRHGCEPKRLRLVCTHSEHAPSLLLVEGRRGGKPGLSIEPPLILQTSNGKPTPEVDTIYFRQQEDTP
jgi:tRNA1(Val) A37 N6-methylase TrmN6